MSMYSYEMQADLAAGGALVAHLHSVEEVTEWCKNSGGNPVSGDHLALVKHRDR